MERKTDRSIKNRIIANLSQIVELMVTIMVIGLIVLMFTGKTGAFISAGVFALLVIVANLPTKGQSKTGVVKALAEEEEEKTEDGNKKYRVA